MSDNYKKSIIINVWRSILLSFQELAILFNESLQD